MEEMKMREYAPDFWKKVAQAGSLPTTATAAPASNQIEDFFKHVEETGSLPTTSTPLVASTRIEDFYAKVAAQGLLPVTSTLVAFTREDDYWQYVAENGVAPISVGNTYSSATDLFDAIVRGVSGVSLGPELITDWDMELAGVTSWPAYSSPTTREKVTTQKYAGSQSLHIISGGGVMGATQVLGTLELNATYRVSVYAKCASGTAFLYSNIPNAGYQIVGQTAATSWTLLTADIVCLNVSARSILIVGNGTSEVYFDNASVRKVP